MKLLFSPHRSSSSLILSLLIAVVGNCCDGAIIGDGETHIIEIGLTDFVNTLKDDGTEGLGDLFTWDMSNTLYLAGDDVVPVVPGAVGKDHGYCIRLTNAGDDSEWLCTWNVFLDDGSLALQGPLTSAESNIAMIIGGTGEYKHAKGYMDVSLFGPVNEDGTANTEGTANAWNFHFKEVELNPGGSM